MNDIFIPVRNNTYLENVWKIEECSYLKVLNNKNWNEKYIFNNSFFIDNYSKKTKSVVDNYLVVIKTNYSFMFDKQLLKELKSLAPLGLIVNNKIFKYVKKISYPENYLNELIEKEEFINEIKEISGIDLKGKTVPEMPPFFLYEFKEDYVGEENIMTKYSLLTTSKMEKNSLKLYVSESIFSDTLKFGENEIQLKYSNLYGQKFQFNYGVENHPVKDYLYKYHKDYSRLNDIIGKPIFLQNKDKEIELVNSVRDSELVLLKETVELKQKYIDTIYNQIRWFLNIIKKDTYFVPRKKEWVYDSYGTKEPKNIIALVDLTGNIFKENSRKKQKLNKKLTKKESASVENNFSYKTEKNVVSIIRYYEGYNSNQDIKTVYYSNNDIKLSLGFSVSKLEELLSIINEIIFDALNNLLIKNNLEDKKLQKIQIESVVKFLNDKLLEEDLNLEAIPLDNNTSICFQLNSKLKDTINPLILNGNFKHMVNVWIEKNFSIIGLTWSSDNTSFYKTDEDDISIFI